LAFLTCGFSSTFIGFCTQIRHSWLGTRIF
jgi:hypothetical protein